MEGIKFNTVNEYILALPVAVQEKATKLRKVISEAIPEAEEVISYNMPAFKYHGILLYYAVHKLHIGFYPTPSAIVAFKSELSEFKYAKGSVQFPLNKAIPYRLISEMARFRFLENLEKHLHKP